MVTSVELLAGSGQRFCSRKNDEIVVAIPGADSDEAGLPQPEELVVERGHAVFLPSFLPSFAGGLEGLFVETGNEAAARSSSSFMATVAPFFRTSCL
jgi:hypothetical protein